LGPLQHDRTIVQRLAQAVQEMGLGRGDRTSELHDLSGEIKGAFGLAGCVKASPH
jgi:hypothetical protein